MGDPQNGRFLVEHPIKMDALVPHFRKPPYIDILLMIGF